MRVRFDVNIQRGAGYKYAAIKFHLDQMASRVDHQRRIPADAAGSVFFAVNAGDEDGEIIEQDTRLL